MKSLDETILKNLLVEREFAIAKIQVTTLRLERLEELIDKQRKKLEEKKGIA